ncbi:MAG: hypothetical protein RL653_1653 [Pseudomonadota bacterium]|jgi:serine/threonine-protein kinase
MSDPLADEVRPGSILRGTYEITSLIGEGGMGQVFAARHVRLPKQVAVKILKTDLKLSPDIVARFRREAEIASRLGHPNIVEVLDFDTLPGGTPFLVLEYLKGESLAQRLARGPLSLEETREIALQVGSALLAAHQAGVVHRDLKPDNIFLLPGDSTGATRHRVKLLDFGISKLSDSRTVQTQDSVLIGTPRYMSPEQALGNNQALDARSDVFALGCIYYEMLSGQPAFPGENIPTLLYKIVHDAPRPLPELVPGIPANVWPALQRALAKRVDERTPDVATLTEEFTGTRLIRVVAPAASATDSTVDTLDATFVPSRPAHATPHPTAVPTPAPARPPGTAPGQGEPPLEDTHVPAPAPAASALAAPSLPPLALPEQPAPVVPPTPVPAPVPQAAAPVARGASWPRFAVAGLVAGLVVLVIWQGSRTPGHTSAAAPTPPRDAPAAPAAQPPAAATAAPTPPAPPTPVPPRPAPNPVAPRATEEKASPPRKEPARTASVAPQTDSFSPKDERARMYLERAEQALRTRNAEAAYLSAQDSIRIELSSNGISALTRAYCLKRDLSNAVAEFRKVPFALQGACKQYCAQFDIELGRR